MKKSILIILSIVLVISFTGCGATTATNTPEEVKLLSSEDYSYNTAMVNRYEGDSFEIPLISWEFVDENMVRIIGQRKSEIGDKVHITNYDFLIDKTNVTLYTIDREEQ